MKTVCVMDVLGNVTDVFRWCCESAGVEAQIFARMSGMLDLSRDEKAKHFLPRWLRVDFISLCLKKERRIMKRILISGN